jgi:hypothetical protein
MEKDIIKVFKGLYSRPEDQEAYQDILDNDHGFCKQLIDFSLYHSFC